MPGQSTEMNLFKIAFTLLLLSSTTCCFSQEAIDCNSFKSGKFKYLDVEDTTAFIVMNKDKQVEYFNNKMYSIESTVKWIAPCTYLMRMEKCTVPDFPYKPGDVMKVEINRIADDIIYYTSSVKGTTWTGRFIRIKK